MWIHTKGKVALHQWHSRSNTAVSFTEKRGGGGYSDEDVPVCVYMPALCLLRGENKKSFTQVPCLLHRTWHVKNPRED